MAKISGGFSPTEEKSRNREMSSGLLRQRRNLMAISTFLAIYSISNAKIDKLNFLGNAIEIGNPSSITIFIFILFFYFLLRYYQYFNEEIHVKKAKNELKNTINEIYINFLKKNVLEGKGLFTKISRKVNYIYPNMFENDSLKKYTSFKRKGLIKAQILVPSGFSGKSTTDEDEEMIKLFEENTNWDRMPKSEGAEIIYKAEISISVIFVFYFNFKGTLAFLIKNSLFTDYYLPFLVSFSVILIYLFY